MRKPLLLVAVGAILLLLFLLMLWPARVAVGWLLPENVALSGLRGTVWQGTATQLNIDGHPIGALSWDARLFSLLGGRPRWQIELSRASGFRPGRGGGHHRRLGYRCRSHRVPARSTASLIWSNWLAPAGT